jgi:uncharacterized protein (TIGR02147 family)
MEQERFRTFLRTEFMKRRHRNERYSLRSFAKQLGLDAGSLSQFLSGQRRYSEKKLKSLTKTLGLDSQETRRLLDENKYKGWNPHFVELDRLHLLSQWYYAAIIEMLALDDFQANPKWIAKQLNIEVNFVQLALSQLFAAGVLSLSADGKWVNNWTEYTTQTSETVDELALRNHQKQLLELAAQSIDYNTAEEKSHTAYVSAIDSDLIPLIQEEIKLFRRKMARLIKEKSKKNDSVYYLQFNLFPAQKALPGEKK